MNIDLIDNKILSIYKECKIQTFPIDCELILQHYGFVLYTYKELQNANKTLYNAAKSYSNDAFRFRMSIYYNSCMPKNRIRFTLMHELGHFILGHQSQEIESEQEADYFASCMLVPRIAILRTGCTTADDIHDQFEVSYAAANRILSDFRHKKDSGWGKSDQAISNWLYPPEPKIPSKQENSMISSMPEKKDRKETARQRKRREEMEERARFLSTYFPAMYGSIWEVTDYPENY
mgnify:FL=1